MAKTELPANDGHPFPLRKADRMVFPQGFWAQGGMEEIGMNITIQKGKILPPAIVL